VPAQFAYVQRITALHLLASLLNGISQDTAGEVTHMLSSVLKNIICTPAQPHLINHLPCVRSYASMFSTSAEADAEQPAASSSASSEDAAAAAAPAADSSSSSTKRARARHISLDDPELNIYLK
jgi:hypothetical protein